MGTQSSIITKLALFTMKLNKTSQYHLLSIKSKSIYLSEGCMQLKDHQKCSWIFELILTWQSHPKIKRLDHQVWKIKKLHHLQYCIACYDNADRPQLVKKVNIEDFPLKKLEILLKDQVALLPVEI